MTLVTWRKTRVCEEDWKVFLGLELLDLGAVRKVLGTTENTPKMQHSQAISAQG